MAPPAPWQLRGSAFVLVTRKTLPLQAGETAPLATLGLVRYQSSPVGPYDELLWCQPRRLSVGTRWSVGPIVVSSQESVEGGRANWGIPKDRAHFDVVDADDGVRATVYDDDGRVFADLHVCGRGPALPVSSKWLPGSLGVLTQERDGRLYTYRPRVRSPIRYAAVRRLSCAEPFPRVGPSDILAAFELRDFEMEFPVARERAA